MVARFAHDYLEAEEQKVCGIRLSPCALCFSIPFVGESMRDRIDPKPFACSVLNGIRVDVHGRLASVVTCNWCAAVG